MAHLKACGEWELANLDQSHPVIASATLSELSAALREASRLLRCPLEGKVERWLSGSPEFATGLAAQWKPLREARHAGLQWRSFRSGCTALVHNPVEVFQVCYRIASSYDILYHIQPLSAPEAGAYHLWIRHGLLPVKLEAPLHSDFTPTRNPTGSMSVAMMAAALDHTNRSDIPGWELPLHEFIKSNI